jgi:bifunctional UDP-N-acetylglucosamine pyrophosphorylase/glucosamine-1-phosphate N-acetyltransferase
MKSTLPKVLHRVAGVAMVHWSVEAALAAGSGHVVLVVGHGREAVIEAVTARFGDKVRFAVQTEQRGTADAVRAGMTEVPSEATEVLITYGDVPCVPAEALTQLIEARARSGAPLAMITTEVTDPTGYGRVLRDDGGRIRAIREHKDCSADERAVRCVNPGLYVADRAFLAASLGRIGSSNAQGEFYLTDLVEIGAREGGVGELAWEPVAVRGVNDRAELAATEAFLWQRIADGHRRAGSTVATGVFIDRDVTIEPGVTIGPNVVLRGRTSLGSGTTVDAGCVLEDAAIGRDVLLKPYTLVTRCEVHEGAQLGPFANLRPDSVVEAGAHVGNFVELKKTRLGKGAKANHLAYLGDGVIGPRANVGAGTIFCNYDGFRKHVTTIEEGAFIGSNSSLVAPVIIGKNAYVGSGSVVTRDVPEDALAIGRAKQENKEGYGKRLRERFSPKR